MMGRLRVDMSAVGATGSVWQQDALPEQVGRKIDAGCLQTGGEGRPHARRHEATEGPALYIDTLLLINENVLADNRFALHADDLGHVGDAARPPDSRSTWRSN